VLSVEYVRALLTVAEEPVKKSNFLYFIFFALWGGVFVLFMAFVDVREPEKPLYSSIEQLVQTRQSLISASFNPYEGGLHRQLGDMIKRSLHNPQTFRVVDTGYWDHGNVLVVQMIFEARNQYNDYFQQMVIAKSTLDGDLISVISPCSVEMNTQGRCQRLLFYSNSLKIKLLNKLLFY
tara:strand:- start:21974 stop:22510 length:537 start_codon:yes stop_codon:yes gene_type:complete